MKKYLYALVGMALLLSMQTVNSYDETFKEGAIDAFDDSQIVQVKRGQVIGGEENFVSKMFVQVGKNNETNKNVIRFSVAIKGDVESMSFVRQEVEDRPENRVSVETIYASIKAGEEVLYFDGNNPTTNAEFAKEYYWACYSIALGNASYESISIPVSFHITFSNEETQEVKLESSYSYNHCLDLGHHVHIAHNKETHYYFCDDCNKVLTTEKAHSLKTIETSNRSTTKGCEECDYHIYEKLIEAEHLIPINPKSGYKITNKTADSLKNQDPITYGTTAPSGDNLLDHVNNVEAYEFDLYVENATENLDISFALPGSAINQENKVKDSIAKIEVNGVNYEIDPDAKSKTITRWFAANPGYAATLKLDKGYNKIRITPVSTSTRNFDYIKLVSDQKISRYDLLEGEDNFAMKEGVDTSINPPISGVVGWGKRTTASASGGAIAQQGQFLKFDFDYNSYTARSAKLYVSCIIGGSESVTGKLNSYFTSLKVNGIEKDVSGITIKGSSWYNGYPIYALTIDLINGNNTIDITTGTANFSLDYISII